MHPDATPSGMGAYISFAVSGDALRQFLLERIRDLVIQVSIRCVRSTQADGRMMLN
jgi:hypothetical protein